MGTGSGAATRLAAATLLAFVLPNAADATTVRTGDPVVLDAAEPAKDGGLTSFLDRLMMAESGGRDHAANPRSTAIGPFQFIKSTFLYVARRYFGAEVAGRNDDEVLVLRTDRPFARRAAEVYSRENAGFLGAHGLAATPANLRLAFLLGPGDAARVLEAAPETPVKTVLKPAVIRANPFMARMAARDLIAKAERDVARTEESADTAVPIRVSNAIPRPAPVGRPGEAKRDASARVAGKIARTAAHRSAVRVAAVKSRPPVVARTTGRTRMVESRPAGRKT